MYLSTEDVEILAHARGRRARVSLFFGISDGRYVERVIELWEHQDRWGVAPHELSGLASR